MFTPLAGTRVHPAREEGKPLVSSAAGPDHGIPVLTLTAKGVILSANAAAAALLGRPLESLPGLHFGEWASAEPEADLEVLALDQGSLVPVAVHAERVGSDEPGDESVTIRLEPTQTMRVATLAEVLSLACADANRFFPRGEGFVCSVSRWPDVCVPCTLRQVVGGWIAFLAEMAGEAQMHLRIRAELDEDDRLAVWLSITPAQGQAVPAQALARAHGEMVPVRPGSGVSVWLPPTARELSVCLELPVA